MADNCTDATADIARSVGVEVIERIEPDRRGKGFALDFAREHLERAPPQVVIVIDADCATDSESLARLISRCMWQTGCIDGHKSCNIGELGTGQTVKGMQQLGEWPSHVLVPLSSIP